MYGGGSNFEKRHNDQQSAINDKLSTGRVHPKSDIPHPTSLEVHAQVNGELVEDDVPVVGLVAIEFECDVSNGADGRIDQGGETGDAALVTFGLVEEIGVGVFDGVVFGRGRRLGCGSWTVVALAIIDSG